jgi:hypothetical protein
MNDATKKHSCSVRCPQRMEQRVATHKSAEDSGLYNDQFSNDVQESLSTNWMGK